MAGRADITLGILAGGRASRLDGRDKAWLRRGGVSQVERLAGCLRDRVGAVLVSANRDRGRYEEAGIRVVADSVPGIGPIGGLHALAHACAGPWLLSVPVDAVTVDGGLVPRFAAAGPDGAYAVDEDGVQPLLALWPVARLRPAVDTAIAAGAFAVRGLQRQLRMAPLALPGMRLGNLNTPQDLADAGVDPA